LASAARLVTSDLLTARRGDLFDFFVAAFFVAAFFVAAFFVAAFFLAAFFVEAFFVAVFFGVTLAADLDADLDADFAAPEEDALLTGSACAAEFSIRALGNASAPASKRIAIERSVRGVRGAWVDCPEAGDANFLFMRLRPFQ
jgi:hypothetical protein